MKGIKMVKVIYRSGTLLQLKNNVVVITDSSIEDGDQTFSGTILKTDNTIENQIGIYNPDIGNFVSHLVRDIKDALPMWTVISNSN